MHGFGANLHLKNSTLPKKEKRYPFFMRFENLFNLNITELIAILHFRIITILVAFIHNQE